MNATTLRGGRVAATLIATVAALAIPVAPSYAAQGAWSAGSPTAVCGGSGNCS